MSATDLAIWSDRAVAAAIMVYALAMVCLAVTTARLRLARPAPAEVVTANAAMVFGPSATSADESTSGAAWGPGSTPTQGFLERLGVVLLGLGVVLHSAGLLTRGLAAGRAPWGNMYEFTLAASLAAAVVLLARIRLAAVRVLAVWVVGIVLLALGLAVTVLYAPADDLVPVLKSYWLVVHVAAAITGGGIFTLGFVASVAYLFRERAERRGAVPRDGLPSAGTLDRLIYGAHMVAFPIWTFAVIAGAIWAENAWGRYWGWDPKETWAFITWVCYAAYLHAQATPSWRGRRAAWLGVVGYMAFLFNFFGVNLWISGLHSYAGV
ncbi:c-type cytochrome biogenesis protein CcsB [Nocardioides halotolerans]|jgi:cytochrome c-type biogenesis protein CcsB|uniref:c-type cytochrome biogenesis protein CcsB n=1 Tax=Nocardioides halotolerans TaxID=433660 RepID=UPI00048A4D2C|nr:c-type cytochrome biogenesis protein CcsB [Nocardioides halotolerans]